MANLTILINEKISLDNNDKGILTTQTISNISYVDNRSLNITSGSVTTLFSLSNVNGAGTFITSSVQYVRITNPSSTPIKLILSSSKEAMSYLISTGSSYIVSTSKITGSLTSLTFDDIVSIKAEPSGSDAKIEYFIATT